MEKAGTRFKNFCISLTKMRRGSAEITVTKDDKPTITEFFKEKKSSAASVLKGKRKQRRNHERPLRNGEEEEALRCLDEIIELENRAGLVTSTGHILRPIKSPYTNDVETETNRNESTVVTSSRKQKRDNVAEMKYGTIKGFDSFMLY